MQPLKITIPGQYWDSQIYRGRLYLFERDGGLVTLDWDGLIDDIDVAPSEALALRCAFANSDFLYDPRIEQILSDIELRPIMRSKFERIAQRAIEIGRAQFEKRILKRQTNPFPFPHADCMIYWHRMYIAGPSGIWSATCTKKTVNPVSSRPKRSWDASVVALAALYGTLACAAGDDGLYEFGIRESRDPERVSQRNCIDCQWTYQSIYGSSHIAHGFLAEYARIKVDEFTFTRSFERLIDDAEIFQDVGYSWGTQDKLCQAVQGRVHIVKYKPSSAEPEERLLRLQTIMLDTWKGEVVSGKLAVFGAIIECEAAIVVALSDETTVTLHGEPINWRVFPKSHQYANHLHAIYDDHLLIASFNQDYFTDQESKRFGITHYRPTAGWSGQYRQPEPQASTPDRNLGSASPPTEPTDITDLDLF